MDGSDSLTKAARPAAPGQLAAVRSLPDNDKAVWPVGRWTIPAHYYLGDEQWALEQKNIFGRMPLPVAPSALLGAPGTYVCREAYGQQVILTRDTQGQVHAMLNACRHRGSRLTTETEPQKGRLLVCPFHAWSYDLGGKLVAVPREENFEGLDKAKYGLVSLPCLEAGGLIWVGMNRAEAADFSVISDTLVRELDAVGLGGMHLFAKKTHTVEGNWKLIMDTFMEGYHVTRLHKNSLGDMFEDTIPTVESIGPHMRRTAGRVRFVQSSVEAHADSVDSLRRIVVFVYNLFPSAVLICSPHYVNLLILMPEAKDRTRVDNFMLTNHEPATEKELDRAVRSFDLVANVTFPEDFSAAENSHKGLETGAIDELLMGGIEQYIATFHASVQDYMRRG